jgi:hypothetical protein
VGEGPVDGADCLIHDLWHEHDVPVERVDLDEAPVGLHGLVVQRMTVEPSDAGVRDRPCRWIAHRADDDARAPLVRQNLVCREQRAECVG